MIKRVCGVKMRIFKNIKLCVLMSLLISSGMAYSAVTPVHNFTRLVEENIIDTRDYYNGDIPYNNWAYHKDFETSPILYPRDDDKVQQLFYTNLAFKIEDTKIKSLTLVNKGKSNGMWIHVFGVTGMEITNLKFNSVSAFQNATYQEVSLVVRSNAYEPDFFMVCKSSGSPGKLILRLEYTDGYKIDINLFHTKVKAYCNYNGLFPKTTLISDISLSKSKQYYYDGYTQKIMVVGHIS